MLKFISRIIFPFLLLPAMIVTTAAAASADEASSRYIDLMGEADSAIARGEYEEAEARLLEALRLEPANAANLILMSNLGMVQFYMGHTDDALATLTAACESSPRAVSVLSNRAKVLMTLGRTDEAMADFSTILSVDSTATRPLFYRGLFALRNGDIAAATADFNRLAAADPDSFEANFAMATLKTSQGDNEGAIPYFNRMIELDPQAEYYGARALCNLQLDRLNEASEDIAQGIALDPADGELYLYRAMLNKMRFRPDDADADARKALQYGVARERVAPFLKKEKH